MAELPCAPPKVMGKGKVPRPLFNGNSVLRRTRITRAVAEEEQWRLALRKANVWTLQLEWVRRRLNNKALGLFGAVWHDVPQYPEPHSSNNEPKLRINEADAKKWKGLVSFAKRRNNLRRLADALHRCRREGRWTEKALRCMAKG
ncbi:hypothetical protein ERJ75_000179800 [Trypanosoma vivax]|nr:hypothetical protein ERJ75_000179800 [Trypanosoma vivax]